MTRPRQFLPWIRSITCCALLGSEILTPAMYAMLPANFAWGDADYRSLYITASTSVYRIRVQVSGLPVF